MARWETGAPFSFEGDAGQFSIAQHSIKLSDREMKIPPACYYAATFVCIGVCVLLIISMFQNEEKEPAVGQPDPTEPIAPKVSRPAVPQRDPVPLPPQPDPAGVGVDSANSLPKPSSPPAELKDQERQNWIIEYCGELTEFSYLDDVASLKKLLAELGNSEIEIVDSAYDSLKARHDKRAIPFVEKRMEEATSAIERKHLQDLIDALNTPSITDPGVLEALKRLKDK